MIGRPRRDAFSFLTSCRGLPRELFGFLSQTTEPQSPRPHFLISTFAEPSSLAQMPEGSAAEASEGLEIASTAARRTKAGAHTRSSMGGALGNGSGRGAKRHDT